MKMNVLQSGSMRELVSLVNDLNIQKEDILTLMQDARTDEFMLIYYQ